MKGSILKLGISLSLVIVLLSQLVTSPGCANMVPPTGGPRDSLPPVLVSVNPPDSSKNFGSKRIVFQFDEFVDIDNPRENVLVSPLPKIDPIVVAHLRTVTVTIKDTLQPNVTYTIDFGSAIKDINEGNVYKNFKYMFSTGDRFDSLEITGNVIVAETGAVDSTLIVMLHSVLTDSAVAKERPKYIARLQNDGRFRFENLPAGIYALYAMKDEGGQKRYLSKSQLFAFADSNINTAAHPPPVTLYAYVEKKEEQPVSNDAVSPNRLGTRRQGAATDRLGFTSNVADGSLDLLGNLEMNFATKLRNFDSTKLRLTTDSFQNVSGYYFIRDTSNKKVTLVYKWVPNTAYDLILEKEFATDSAGKQIARTDTISFRTKQERDYGEIRLRLLNLDLTKNPVLQFVQSGDVKFSYPLTSRNFNVKLFLPGDYDLRILFDNNKNGKWDPGQFYEKRRQPEKVMPIPRKLNVKANWLNEVDITL